jgi:hypothetical protein
MRRKGILTLIIAVFSVVAFASMAFAAQNIFLKTSVPDIPISPCWQAGTQTMEMDNLTVLTNGDVIQFSLQNGSTLCKSFDYFLTLHDGVGATSALLPGSTGSDAVTSTDPVNDVLISSVSGVPNQDYGFHVKGTAGSQTYTVTVKSRTAGVLATNVAFQLTFQAAPATLSDVFIVKLFDEKFGAPYFWKKNNATPALYLANTISDDNALCVNTSVYPNEYLDSTPNSVPNIVGGGKALAFSGDYTIAHIVNAQRFETLLCKDAVAGHIKIGKTGVQGADSCNSFDFETAPAGYCTDHNALNRFVIHAMDVPFPVDQYNVKLEILVDRQDGLGFLGGDRGVYFSSTLPTIISASSLTGACGATGQTFAVDGFASDGSTSKTPASAGSDCTIDDANRAVIIKSTTASNLNITAGDSYLVINLPPFNYNLSSIKSGDVVKVQATLLAVPCGTLGPVDVIVGTFGCGNVVLPGSSCLFPYFTGLAAGEAFWDGIAVVNTGIVAGTVDLKAFKKDGTTATFTTPSIAPGSMFVSVVSSIPWVGTTPANTPAFITAVSKDIPFGSMSGFGFMSDDGTSSMGYLPVCGGGI